MEPKPVVLVLADISGYTRFIHHRRMSLAHAEQVISDLLEAVVERAEFPLTLNKFEGDAVFLYAVHPPERATEAARDVLKQIFDFGAAFAERRAAILAGTRCTCEGCQQVSELKLKAFAHAGEALFKEMRGFHELAGEDVILVHRLMKNTVEGKEYVLVTDRFHGLAGQAPGSAPRSHQERIDDLGEVAVWVYGPEPAAAVVVPKPGFLQRLAFDGRLQTRLLMHLLGLRWRKGRPSNIPL